MFNRKLRSLVFFHVAKTGGTSAAAALRSLFADARTDDGNLSAACLTSQPLGRDVLYYGHPLHAVAQAVPQGAVTATVLRAPAEQAVSNYLHLLRNPHLPFHGDAVRLRFSGLMAAQPLLLAYQAVSLNVAMSDSQIHTPAQLFARLPAVGRFLDRIDVVGCLDQLDAVLRRAAWRTGRSDAVLSRAPLLNAATDFGTRDHEVHRLRAEYQGLAADPLLRRLMAAEAALVAHARSRCRSWVPWRLPSVSALRVPVGGAASFRTFRAG